MKSNKMMRKIRKAENNVAERCGATAKMESVKNHLLLGLVILIFLLVFYVQGTEYEPGTFPEKHPAVIQTVVVLDTGDVYVVEEADGEATVNTYKSGNPNDWEVTKWSK